MTTGSSDRSAEPRMVLAYLHVSTRTETCDYGEEHQVAYCQISRLRDAGRTTTVSNGYEMVNAAILIDEQGREHVEHRPIDFAGAVRYAREDGLSLANRVGGTRSVRDLSGASDRAAGRCPSGPAFDPDDPAQKVSPALLRSIGVVGIARLAGGAI